MSEINILDETSSSELSQQSLVTNNLYERFVHDGQQQNEMGVAFCLLDLTEIENEAAFQGIVGPVEEVNIPSEFCYNFEDFLSFSDMNASVMEFLDSSDDEDLPSLSLVRYQSVNLIEQALAEGSVENVEFENQPEIDMVDLEIVDYEDIADLLVYTNAPALEIPYEDVADYEQYFDDAQY